MSESAVSDKPLLLYGLARNRRSPKRPSEPRFMRRTPGGGRSGERCAAAYILALKLSPQELLLQNTCNGVLKADGIPAITSSW